MKEVHYERINIKEARKLWSKGEKIYCYPIYSKHDNVQDGIYISMYTDNNKDNSFDEYVKMYKSVSRNNMRYYTQSFIEKN